MPTSRRGFLRQLPAFPLAIGAAVSQGPALLRTLSQPTYDLPAFPAVEEITLETRIGWFESNLVLLTKPTLAMPRLNDMITIDGLRAITQWEMYAEKVANAARACGLPLDRASEIAGIALR